jgi:phasin family protein
MAAAASSNADNKSEGYSGFKMPKMDMEAVLNSQKKNLEILGLMNKMTMEVCSGVTRLQTTFIKQLINDVGEVVSSGAKPSEAFAQLSEITRDSIVKAINDGKKISDMIATSNNELTTALAKRCKEGPSEAQQAFKK